MELLTQKNATSYDEMLLRCGSCVLPNDIAFSIANCLELHLTHRKLIALALYIILRVAIIAVRNNVVFKGLRHLYQ